MTPRRRSTSPLLRAARWAVLCALVLLSACSDDAPPQDVALDPCAPGASTTVDGEAACVYDATLIIETGFKCPPDMPYQHTIDGVTLCAGQECLPHDVYDDMGRALPEHDFPDYCPQGACALGDADRCDLIPTNNATACAEGERRCGSQPDQIDVCEGGVWTTPIACVDGWFCQAGDCVPPPQQCSPGETRCADPSTAERCDASGTGWVQEACAEGAYCAEGACFDPCADVTCALEGDVCTGGICIEPGACSAARHLERDGELTEHGYALQVTPGGDNANTACNRFPYENGRDALVRFVPDESGQWLFLGTGEHLWSLTAQDTCDAEDTLDCSLPRNYHGGDPFGPALHVSAQLEAGQPVYLTLDGCPTGLTCSYTIQAVRPLQLGDACTRSPSYDPENPVNTCADDQVCSRDEVPVCAEPLPPAPPAIVRSEDARAWNVDGELRFMVHGEDASENTHEVWYTLLDAEGDPIEIYPGAPIERRGWSRTDLSWRAEFTAKVVLSEYDVSPELAPSVAALRVWFRDGDDMTSDAIDLDVRTDLPEASAEGPCDTLIIEDRCVEGTLCRDDEDDATPFDVGVCRAAFAPEVVSAQVWLNPDAPSIAIRAEVTDGDLNPRGVRVELRDSDDNVLLPINAYDNIDPVEAHTFEAEHDLTHRDDVDWTQIDHAAVIAVDRDDFASAPMIVPITAPEEVDVGDACSRFEARQRCPEDARCDSTYEDGADQPYVCHADTAICPEDWDVLDINTLAPDGETSGYWFAEAPPEDARRSDVCNFSGTDLSAYGSRVFTFTAPATGGYEFEVNDPNLSLQLRSHCAFPSASLRGCEYITYLDLEEGQTVYAILDVNLFRSPEPAPPALYGVQVIQY